MHMAYNRPLLGPHLAKSACTKSYAWGIRRCKKPNRGCPWVSPANPVGNRLSWRKCPRRLAWVHLITAAFSNLYIHLFLISSYNQVHRLRKAPSLRSFPEKSWYTTEAESISGCSAQARRRLSTLTSILQERSKGQRRLLPTSPLALSAPWVWEHPSPLGSISTICQLYFAHIDLRTESKAHDTLDFPSQNACTMAFGCKQRYTVQEYIFHEFQGFIQPYLCCRTTHNEETLVYLCLWFYWSSNCFICQLGDRRGMEFHLVLWSRCFWFCWLGWLRLPTQRWWQCRR